jgi:hypothetical protein
MAQQQLSPNQITNTVITDFTGNRTIADVDNNVYLRRTSTTASTVTLNSTPATGFTCILVNRGTSGTVSISAASGVYKNGAASTATTGTLALGGKVTLFHEGSGVWTADGSGLT